MSLQQQKFKVKIKLWRGRVAAPWVPSHGYATAPGAVYTKRYNAGMLLAPFYQLPDRLPKMVYPYILANALKAPQTTRDLTILKQ